MSDAAARPTRRFRSRGRSAQPGRPRTAARLAAVQALYQAEHAGAPAEAVLEEFVRHRVGGQEGAPLAAGPLDEGGAPGADVPLLARILRGWAANAETLDRVVAAALAEDWPLARLDPVLRALLRAASAELLDAKGPPARAVINEYMDVAHGFFAGDEPRFANGVLDRIARTLRAAEFADAADARG
jgi:N utilization substance protein B